MTTETTKFVYVTPKILDGVYILIINNPGSKLNTLQNEFFSEMEYHLKILNSDPKLKAAVVMSGKSGCFLAGADLKGLSKERTFDEWRKQSRYRQKFNRRIATSRKPIITAVRGLCLGGGLEFALSCQYRIAVDDKFTIFGFPEVTLGILPGAGGTQRAPKLIGLKNSLDLILTGKRINSQEAKNIGLVDMTVNLSEALLLDGNANKLLEDTAVGIAKRIAYGQLHIDRNNGVFKKLAGYFNKSSMIRRKILKMAQEHALAVSGGHYPAIVKIIEVIRTGLEEGDDRGYAAENKAFAELILTSQSKGLMALFFGQNECKRNRVGVPPNEIKTIGILGAGLMGSGIAQISIDKGYMVIVKDTNRSNLDKGLEKIKSNFDALITKGKILDYEKDRFLSNLKATLDYNSFSDVDIVVEAVFENIDVKHNVIKELEESISPKCIIASNTSAIPIEKIAVASSRPDKFIGMHYFSPVDKMQLLEIIATSQTSQDTIATAVSIGIKQGKIVIVVGDGPGFYTTRILAAMTSEAVRLMQEGVHPWKLDAITKQFGFPLGVCSLVDALGLDVGSHIAAFLFKELGERFRGGNLKIMKELVAIKCYGKKSGKGIYVYETGKKSSENKPLNPLATEILQKYLIQNKNNISDEDIQMRLVSRFVNEAVLCLEEKILQRPLDGDVGAVYGLGFPPFTGGPFRWIDTYGAAKLVEKMKMFERTYGASFTPAKTLIEMKNNPLNKFYSTHNNNSKL